MVDLMEIVDKLIELNDAEQELLMLMSSTNKTCALLFILHKQREEQINKLLALTEK